MLEVKAGKVWRNETQMWHQCIAQPPPVTCVECIFLVALYALYIYNAATPMPCWSGEVEIPLGYVYPFPPAPGWADKSEKINTN